MRGRALGALNMYAARPTRCAPAREPHARSGQPGRRRPGRCLANFDEITLTSNLRRALSTRGVIDQAIGIVIAHQHLTPEEAFDVLRRISQSRNVRLHQVASELVIRAEATPRRIPLASDRDRRGSVTGRRLRCTRGSSIFEHRWVRPRKPVIGSWSVCANWCPRGVLVHSPTDPRSSGDDTTVAHAQAGLGLGGRPGVPLRRLQAGSGTPPGSPPGSSSVDSIERGGGGGASTRASPQQTSSSDDSTREGHMTDYTATAVCGATTEGDRRPRSNDSS